MDCIFCKIIAGEIPSKKVYEDEQCYAFYDIEPVAPTHVLVIPKKHIASLAELNDAEAPLAGHLLLVIKKIAAQLGLDKDGYRVVNNIGEQGGQTVFHLHFHLLGNRELSWPPG
jgi:histidine triad (HIT) family protein